MNMYIFVNFKDEEKKMRLNAGKKKRALQGPREYDPKSMRPILTASCIFVQSKCEGGC